MIKGEGLEDKRYPPPWVTATVHMLPKTGEIHCDGDEESVQFIQERIYKKGKLHDCLHSIAVLDNLAMINATAPPEEVLKYVNVLAAEWAAHRDKAISPLCPVCGRVGGMMDSKIVHDQCFDNATGQNHEEEKFSQLPV
ncbi:MAG: hypothetical protein DRP09_10220 [Candidatus Thorarchaeota archaeon]|nr:MAG: hypothetical protein DRP09_10220 [Candidatus Thorarchaeota archaeon]